MLPGVDQESQALIERRADRDFAQKTLNSGAILLPLAALYIFPSGLLDTMPGICAIHAVCVMLNVAIRYWLLRDFERTYTARRAWWRSWQTGTTAFSAGTWSVFCGSALWVEPQFSWTAQLVLVFVVAYTAVSVANFVSHLRLYLISSLLLWFFPMAVISIHWERGWAMFAMFVVYTGFLLMQARALHFAYWEGLRSARLLELRAEELEEARRRADLANVAKGRFLANMSHEIRTPMAGILGMTRLALETEMTTEQREYVETTHTTAESLLHLLDELLDFSRIEADRLDLRLEMFDLNALVDSLEKLFAHQARAKGLHFRVIGLLPNQPWLRGDRLRVRQVLINLLSNALKFTTAGSVWLDVRVSEPGAARTVVEFTVGDTGCGIPLDQKARIFQPFVQGDHTAAHGGGTGLGLSICAALVALMHGTIEVESSPGRGSQFRVRLTMETAGERGLPEASEEWAVDLSGMRLLVAEDNAVNQKIIGRLLEKVGCHVTMVPDGQQASDRAIHGTEIFDAILMDVQMPVLDGLAATKRIRERESLNRSTPILALTANALEGDQRMCLEAGMDGFLAKPVQAGQLFRALMARRMRGIETKGPGGASNRRA